MADEAFWIMATKPQGIKRRSQAERSATTISLLIDATVSSLHEHGYSATSTLEVAKRAGVSRGAMLHHYPTKVHLMAATIYATYKSDIEAYRQTLSLLGDAKDGIERLIDTAWACFNSPNGIAQTEIWMAARSDRELAAAALPVYSTMVEQSLRALRVVLANQLDEDKITLEQLLTFIVGSLRGLAIEKVLGAPTSELDASIAFIKCNVRAVLKPL
jgi:AcrR family transcriptional regulator